MDMRRDVRGPQAGGTLAGIGQFSRACRVVSQVSCPWFRRNRFPVTREVRVIERVSGQA